ncbi:hypothetical protein [Bacillus sp. E(2018)]|uniref:hypothetical protein n=1 Tax=Bacillus sp. E(2018) TaxID=2502239 RepID=UPI0010F681D2|nr:hypothetical protein [Bacillus sp. E(2018)]
MTELFRIGIAAILGSQVAYFFAVILLYKTMMDWYEWSTFPDPRNLFEKTVNFLTALVFGVAYWAGLRVKNKNWFMKRVYLLGYVFVYIILAVIVYNILNSILKYIEMNF